MIEGWAASEASSERPRGTRPGVVASLLARRQVLGAGVLVLTIVPAWWMSREAAVDAPGPIAGPAAAAAPGAPRADEAAEARAFSIAELDAHVRDVAMRFGLSPLLVAAVIEAESEFNPRAVSRRGARGLMQLMPLTAKSLQVEDPFDPRENVEAGVQHLKRLLDRFDGDLVLALAAYNAGEPAVLAYGGVPPYRETRRYVARVLRRAGEANAAARVLAPSGRAGAARAERSARREPRGEVVPAVLREEARAAVPPPRTARKPAAPAR